jgi:MrcB-like, N-terminal domain
VNLSDTAVASPSLWVVRGGLDGMIEAFCLSEGYCGIGWPELGDLSVLSDDALSAGLVARYGDSVHKVASARGSIKRFMSIRRGDMVVMPLKTQPGLVAVGVVTGDYEHRPDFPERAQNVRATEWQRSDVARELFGDLLKAIDRPPTVSSVPASPDVVSEMMASGKQIHLPVTQAARAWSAVIAAVLSELDDEPASTEALRRLLHEEAPPAVRALIGVDLPLNDGVGVGTPADVPWLSVYPLGAMPSAQSGFYAVYLFAKDGSAVYLSLNQGTENVRGGIPPLKKRAIDLRTAAGLQDLGDPVDLRSAVTRPRKYEAGSGYALRYSADAIPDDQTLESDLRQFLGYVSTGIPPIFRTPGRLR